MTSSPQSLPRRSLLAAGMAASLAVSENALAHAGRHEGAGTATVLTISGPGVRGNRGAMVPERDLLLKNHGVAFDSAWAASATALERLQAVDITPRIEYDGQPHRLRGPLLASVLQAAGVDTAAAAAQGQWLSLQAIDGYRAQMPLSQALRWRMLLALWMDGQRLALGGLGPQWAMYDADRIAELADRPLKERFAQAPWGLYHVGLHARQPD
ncbi:molybdopterin-dependent oxidoreductase [Delftia sp. PS-11]|uniref:molybdopterin-dependent oxidoreductase n=1 Tax=Delftia sp. PS-11 TaxID=2767222 RepID=UPI0024589C7A|nr:molybdopterin-dependent oxidoreductase [Delftia sp. PS-11]KAJ8746082.1 molybdopterin-dependent oxidoreductase [Delftia sp. PS-11]